MERDVDGRRGEEEEAYEIEMHRVMKEKKTGR